MTTSSAPHVEPIDSNAEREESVQPEETETTGTDPQPQPVAQEETSPVTPLSPEDLALIRDLACRANPDVVPELVGGSTVAEIIASVEPARAAYARIVEAAAPVTPEAPTVPAGAAPPVTIDPDTLTTGQKIRLALQTRK